MGYGGDEAREEARAAGGWKPNLRSAILLGVLASVALTCVARPSVFIYFRF
jgi:hypothetical protein